MSEADITATNKALVLKAITGTFVDRDTSIPGKYFAPDYKQHNPSIPNGNAAIPPPHYCPQPGLQVRAGHDRCGG
jgi:hypothetical protein